MVKTKEAQYEWQTPGKYEMQQCIVGMIYLQLCSKYKQRRGSSLLLIVTIV
jgi:hypothetical protein